MFKNEFLAVYKITTLKKSVWKIQKKGVFDKKIV